MPALAKRLAVACVKTELVLAFRVQNRTQFHNLGWRSMGSIKSPEEGWLLIEKFCGLASPNPESTQLSNIWPMAHDEFISLYERVNPEELRCVVRRLQRWQPAAGLLCGPRCLRRAFFRLSVRHHRKRAAAPLAAALPSTA